MDRKQKLNGVKLFDAKWRYRKLYRRVTQAACRKLYCDSIRSTSNTVMIAGTARSGTTWLAEIIASQHPYRVMFEPFHSQRVKAFGRFHYFQYMRPTEENADLLSYCQKIFSGDIRHPWIDRQVGHLFPRYRLVKEIRANLFLKWIHNLFPGTRLLMLIRHPCAVVLSRMQLRWATDTDIESFLCQPKLVEDFLRDKMDVIAGARSEAGKHAVIWCVHQLVPFKQFRPEELSVVFYEHLCTQPHIEIPRIFQAIDQEYHTAIYHHLVTPSLTTTGTSAVVSGKSVIARWQTELSSKEIDDVLSVVEGFGLGCIYGDSILPL